MSREAREIFAYVSGVRFRGMSTCAQGLYVRAIAAMREMGQCELRVDDGPPDADWMLRMLGVSEAELRHFDTLVRFGVLERVDGVLSSPLLREQQERRARNAEARAAAKAEIARLRAEAEAAGLPPPVLSLRAVTSRQNGTLGGRPKAAIAGQRSGQVPGQRELLGPRLVPSGHNPTGFTENLDQNPTGSEPGGPGAAWVSEASRVLSDCLSEENEQNQTDRQTGSLPRAETQKPSENPTGSAIENPGGNPAPETREIDAVERTGRAVLRIAALDGSSWADNSRPIVQSWFALGLTEDDVVREARRLAQSHDQLRGKGKIRKLSWFTQGLQAVVAARPHEQPQKPAQVEEWEARAKREWSSAVERWKGLSHEQRNAAPLPRLEDFTKRWREQLAS